MIVKKEETIKYTLILTEFEAVWLKGLLQNNPFGSDETSEDGITRNNMFVALLNAGVK